MTIKEYLAGVEYNEELGSIVVYREDYGQQLILDVRGHGYITKILKSNDTTEFQDQVGKFVVEAILEKLDKSEEEIPTPKLVHNNWYLCLLHGEFYPIICRYNETIDMLAQVESNSWGLSRIYHSPESMENVELAPIKSKMFEWYNKFLDSLTS